MAEVEQPIIIKKINKIEGGHHGGAWKVAYADFVTAMMAFFLLLWLLSNASDAQLDGIADYFTPTIGLKDSMGIGFEGGHTDDLEEGTRRNDTARPAVVVGAPPTGVKPGDPKKKAPIESPEGEAMLFEKAASAISQITAQDKTLSQLGENILVEVTPEGLKIQIMDTDKEPMFHPGHVALTKAGEAVLARINKIIEGAPNHISITGHTDAAPFRRRKDFSNWELSTGRANYARRFLLQQGMVEERVAKVVGRADKELLYPAEPTSAKNRRIEIILLRGSYINMPASDQPGTKNVLPTREDGRSDILKFEDKRAAQEKHQDLESKQSVPVIAPPSPITIIPQLPLQDESLGKESVIEFVPR